MKFDRYFSLNEAREELARRWADVGLRTAIEKELDEHFLPEFKEEPRGGVFKNICSPDNAFTFFLQCSNYTGVKPIFFEYLQDIFSRGNSEKMGLGKLRVIAEDNTQAVMSLFSPSRWNGKSLSEIRLHDGTSLVEFHHALVNYAGYAIDYYDYSKWFKVYEKPSEYYYPFLLHFVAHGILFEVYTAEDELDFYNKAIFPNLEKIQKKFGITPIMVFPLPNPNEQTSREDFYWWSYPPHVNAHLLEYAKRHNLALTPIEF